MEKVSTVWALFRQGEAVANPAAWHNGQVTATVLGGILIALVHVLAAFGHPIPLDTDSADSIGAGILAIVNLVFTITASPHVGLPAKPIVQGADSETATGLQSVDSAPVQPEERHRNHQ